MDLRHLKSAYNFPGKMTAQDAYTRGYPQGAIVHFTAGSPSAVSSAEGGIGNNYTFFVISPDGQVYQNVDLNSWGALAGKSSHQKLGNSVSQFLVCIEVCHAGKVRQINDRTFRPLFNDPNH